MLLHLLGYAFVFVHSLVERLVGSILNVKFSLAAVHRIALDGITSVEVLGNGILLVSLISVFAADKCLATFRCTE